MQDHDGVERGAEAAGEDMGKAAEIVDAALEPLTWLRDLKGEAFYPVGGAWRTLYTFTHEPQLLPDYEVTSWYLCNHPDSLFRQVLVAARPAPEGRWTLRDRVLTLHQPDGRSESQTLHGVAELKQALAGNFGIELERIEGLDARLAELAVSATAAR